MSIYMSALMHKLGLAEIYLGDGAQHTALRCIREAMEIANPELAEDEDLGDVSTHILRQSGVRRAVL